MWDDFVFLAMYHKSWTFDVFYLINIVEVISYKEAQELANRLLGNVFDGGVAANKY